MRTGDVGCAKEKLGFVVLEERRMAAAFILVEAVYLTLKLGVGLHCSWFRYDLGIPCKSVALPTCAIW